MQIPPYSLQNSESDSGSRGIIKRWSVLENPKRNFGSAGLMCLDDVWQKYKNIQVSSHLKFLDTDWGTNILRSQVLNFTCLPNKQLRVHETSNLGKGKKHPHWEVPYKYGISGLFHSSSSHVCLQLGVFRLPHTVSRPGWGHSLARGQGPGALTRQMYWLRSPGEKVCERTITLLRTNGRCRALRPLRSLGRTATPGSPASSVLVSLSTWNRSQKFVRSGRACIPLCSFLLSTKRNSQSTTQPWLALGPLGRARLGVTPDGSPDRGLSTEWEHDPLWGGQGHL